MHKTYPARILRRLYPSHTRAGVRDGEGRISVFRNTAPRPPFFPVEIEILSSESGLPFSSLPQRESRNRNLMSRRGVASAGTAKTSLPSLGGQSINQSVNQSTNQSINQALKQSSSQALNRATKQSSNQAVKQSSRQAIKQSSRQAINQSRSQAIKQSSN